MSLLRVFWSRLTSVNTNAIFAPSGDNCGSDTRFSFSMSSTVNAGWAKTVAPDNAATTKNITMTTRTRDI
jgi:hypothetical protein